MTSRRPDGDAVATVDVADPGRMHALGVRLGADARPGDLLVLAGPLGAGKTVLAQGVAAGLGVRTAVTSPTFVIARVHRDGRLPFVHVDAYRLGGVAEVDDLDLDADQADSVTVVEWGAGLVEQLAEEHLLVTIERHPEDDTRRVTLTGSGGRWGRETLQALARPPAG